MTPSDQLPPTVDGDVDPPSVAACPTGSGVARVAVMPGGDEPRLWAAAAKLAGELSLPVVQDAESDPTRFDLLLVTAERRLELRETGRRKAGPVYVDFINGPVAFRRRSARSFRQPIARAVGVREGGVRVVDATAGLGRDAFLLACLGCDVTAVERSPVLAALLGDGLERAAAASDETLRAVVARLRLVTDDAKQVLTGMDGAEAPEVVYLDPMYPPKSKSALAKKELRVCRWLVGGDEDAGELLEIARRTARRRVVVKRHRYASPLAPSPFGRYLGRTVRYDLYRPL